MTAVSKRNDLRPDWNSAPFAYSTQREQLVPIAIWTLVCLLFGSIELSENGVYLSHVLLLLAGGMIILGMLARPAPLGTPYGIFLIVAVAALPLLPLLGGKWLNPRFLPEQMKLLVLIFGASTLAIYVTWRRLRLLAIVMPITLCGLLFFTFFFGTWDYYGAGGRFGVPAFGSPNSTAFVITVNLALALYVASVSRALRIFALGISAVLLGFLIATSSDGGLVCGVLIVLRYLGVKIKTLFYLVAFAVVAGTFTALYMPNFEVPELIGSGRLYIWQYLLVDLFHSGPLNILFGMGPGAIDLRPSFTKSVVSAHSMYLEMLYSYGIVGFSIMVSAIAYLGSRLKRAHLTPQGRIFLEAIFLSLVAGSLVDTYLLTAQLIWLGALVIGFFGLISRTADRPQPLQRA